MFCSPTAFILRDPGTCLQHHIDESCGIPELLQLRFFLPSAQARILDLNIEEL